MSGELVSDALVAFNTREWAGWLAYGIREHFFLTPVPPSFSPPDAFPGAKLYIGRNHDDLAADLVDLHRDLPAPAQARFEDATISVWGELDLDRYDHYLIARIVLDIARKARFKGIVGLIPDALPKLRRMRSRSDLEQVLADLCRSMFLTVVDLATASAASAAAIRSLLDEQLRSEGLAFARGAPAIAGLVRMSSNTPTAVATWIALFAGTLLPNLTGEGRLLVRTTRRSLEKACGGQEQFDEIVRRMRGQSRSESSPTEGYVLLRHWLDGDALLALLVPLAEQSRRLPVPSGHPAATAAETAGALDVG